VAKPKRNTSPEQQVPFRNETSGVAFSPTTEHVEPSNEKIFSSGA